MSSRCVLAPTCISSRNRDEETKDPPAGLQEKEKANKNVGNERGGLRVASLCCDVFADRGGRAIYWVPGTEYRVPGTEY